MAQLQGTSAGRQESGGGDMNKTGMTNSSKSGGGLGAMFDAKMLEKIKEMKTEPEKSNQMAGVQELEEEEDDVADYLNFGKETKNDKKSKLKKSKGTVTKFIDDIIDEPKKKPANKIKKVLKGSITKMLDDVKPKTEEKKESDIKP